MLLTAILQDTPYWKDLDAWIAGSPLVRITILDEVEEKPFVIEEWEPDHPLYGQVTALIEQLDQSSWVEFVADWHLSSHMLVAYKTSKVVGFLRYVIQNIGVEEDQLPFTLNGETLREAKVIAFGVPLEERRKGIGRALQERLIKDSRKAGLFQIRSYSSEQNPQNHLLKASMGFAIDPLPVGRGKDGAYFILPLR